MVDGKVQPVQVETGLENDTQIEITSGLQEGDVVVTGTVTSTKTGTSGASQQSTQRNAGFFPGIGGGGAVRGVSTENRSGSFGR